MSRNSDVYSVPSFRMTLSAGAIVKVGAFPGQLATTIKLLSGGTLEIGSYGLTTNPFVAGLSAVAGVASFATGNTFGQMYPLSLGEAFSANVSGNYYMYASGGTCEVAIASGNSST